MSMTKQLLAHPEINHSGVEHSIVFAALSEEQRRQIVKAATEGEKLALSCEWGDQSDLIGKIYRELIEAPAQRVAQSYPYPHFSQIEKTFFMLFLTDEQRLQWGVLHAESSAGLLDLLPWCGTKSTSQCQGCSAKTSSKPGD